MEDVLKATIKKQVKEPLYSIESGVLAFLVAHPSWDFGISYSTLSSPKASSEDF